MIARAVFLSPSRKQRRTTHARHERRLGADTIAIHAADGRDLHAAACGMSDGRLDVYLCRGWGRIPDVGDVLRGLVASHAARVVDEWGRPMPEYATRPDMLPVVTAGGVREMAGRA